MGEKKEINQKEIAPRVGTFLLLLGLFSLIFFLASDFANQPDFDWLFVGMLLMAIGYGLRRRAAPPPPAGRFSLIRKLRENAKNRKEEKVKKAKQ